MEIGVIGLGRMGANMARRMARGGARVLAYDRDPAARAALEEEKGIDRVEGLASLAAQLAGERVILLMLPAGAATEDTLAELLPLLSAGDTLVDGGNAFYRDSMARALEMSQRGLRYIDAGVSGGVHGLANGYCLMLGGTPKSTTLRALCAPAAPARHRLAALRPERRRAFRQDDPQRHRVRNDAGLRRGLCAAGGGKDRSSTSAPGRDRRHGSVVRSWLLDLSPRSSRKTRPAAHRAGRPDSGEGRWTRSNRWSWACRAGDHHGADGALFQPGQVRLRKKAARHDARQVRRPRDQQGMIVVAIT